MIISSGGATRLRLPNQSPLAGRRCKDRTEPKGSKSSRCLAFLRFGWVRPFCVGGGRPDDPLISPTADVTRGGTQAYNSRNNV